MNQQYRPGGFGLLPPVVKNLLIINGLMFLAAIAFEKAFQYDLNDLLGLHYIGSEKFKPFQYVTYMFMHGGISHIFFNMFALWMFGKTLESVWGPKRFLTYYLITGVGAGLLHTLVVHFEISPIIQLINQFLGDPSLANLDLILEKHNGVNVSGSPELSAALDAVNQSMRSWNMDNYNTEAKTAVIDFFIKYKEHYKNIPVVVGASGSVFGILLAFGMLFPNTLLYLYFAIPVKAKYFVIFYGLLELYLGFANHPGDNVAHFAHLGGMIFGFLLIKYWKNKRSMY